MKSAAIPSIRVEPDLRAQLEEVLLEGESLSGFVEASVRDTVRRRMEQTAFLQRGMASLAAAKRTGKTVAADEVIDKLQARLVAAQTNKGKKKARSAR